MASCQSARYQNKKARKEHVNTPDYLADGAKEVTEENLKKKGKRFRKSRRKAKQQQKLLNELNKKTSKVKRKEHEPVEFKFY